MKTITVKEETAEGAVSHEVCARMRVKAFHPRKFGVVDVGHTTSLAADGSGAYVRFSDRSKPYFVPTSEICGPSR